MAEGVGAQDTEVLRVLVVEDAPTAARVVQRGLVLEGYLVDVASSGRAALAAIRDNPPDLLVLDLSLPDIDGLEVCRRVRAVDAAEERAPTPILMLTGRDAVGDRVAGLNAGADDYLIKPFDVSELIARVRALFRRAKATTPAFVHADVQRFADLTIDPRARTAIRGDRVLQLTAREFDLLAFLLRHQNQVMTQETIMARVWGEDFFGESNVLAVVVASLRRELEACGEPRLIQTVRGVGYVLRPEDRRGEGEVENGR
ncbi:MAG TPA: response regulator transcription factor [Thermomicrobiales bacterium]|jgi:two-component system response regulator MprA